MNPGLLQLVSTVAALLGGVGIGSLVTTFLKDRLERQQFKYKEKLSVYSGYLEALQKSVVESSEVNRQNVVYWHNRLKLISTKEIDGGASKFYDTSLNQDFAKLRNEIVTAMRHDLDKSL